MVLGGIFGLALFSGMAHAVTCMPTGVAATEARVSFNAAFNLCSVYTTSPPVAVEFPYLIFESSPSSGSGTTTV